MSDFVSMGADWGLLGAVGRMFLAVPDSCCSFAGSKWKAALAEGEGSRKKEVDN